MPVLEKLANDPQSQFILAKVNADHNPGLSAQYGVRGIPAVKAFYQGKIVDEFVGAQPEPVVRQFLQRLTARINTRSNTASSKPTQTSTDPQTRLNQARQALKQGQGAEAKIQLQNFPQTPEAKEAALLLPVAEFISEMHHRAGNAQQAAEALRRREHSTAMYYLLTLTRQGSAQEQEQARKVMQGLFAMLGESDPLTQSYRQLIKARNE